MRRPCLFKERDVTRATKGVLAAGLDVKCVQINKDGVIVVVPGKPQEVIPDDETPDGVISLI
jgi:hypothetical protein